MKRISGKRPYAAFAFCAAAAIALPAQTFTTLYTFCPLNGCVDGANPQPRLVQATDGNFYGTTSFGGANNSGTVFKMTPSGALTTLYSFCSQSGCADGQEPIAGLVQGPDGNFYGTTYGNGATNPGTVFKITPRGTLTTLHSFDGTDGQQPWAGLVQAANGDFYGTTRYGGDDAGCLSGTAFTTCGTVFKITPRGTFATLHSFDGTDGSFPLAGLVQATNGDLYGTAAVGGTSCYYGLDACGTVFKITPSGTLTTLYGFCSQPYCPDGELPYAALVQATNGDFYGTTEAGGVYPYAGTVFQITPSGTLTTLHSFCSQSGCADGNGPYAGLVQATNGDFYGTPRTAQTATGRFSK
jgi:uncharacterized repeat protein (TIGR03803 family)